jgi:P-type E1-E2 ATPase
MVAVDGELVGQLIYEDQIRPESARVMHELRTRQIGNLVMLTGDNQASAHHVASQLGINRLYAEVLPNEKAEIVKNLRDKGNKVAMVGDGINDAVALTYADVGIAMENGSDLAQHSADVVLLQDDLTKFVTALDAARNAVSLIHQNYSIVVGMNLVALAMALFGRAIPAEAVALVSNGSAIAASVNGLRPLVR